MRDPIDDVARIREDVERDSARFRSAATALTVVTAKDSTGAVTVTIDATGRITSIVVSMTWRDRYSGQTLANGVSQAVGAAVAEQLNQWGNAVVDDDAGRAPQPLADPAIDGLDDLAGRLQEAATRDPSDRPELAMQIMGDILREVIESIDQVQAEIEAHLNREYEGRSASGHVRARVLGNGTLVDLVLDLGWADSAHPNNIGREATQAVQDAYRRLGERGVEAILAESPVGRVGRLSQDPVAMAQAFGLSR